MESLFDVKKSGVCCRGGAIRSRIHAAGSLGCEAAEEPRFWRTPWRASVFTASVDCALQMRTNLANMEYCISPQIGIGDGHKAQLLVDFMRLPASKQLQQKVLFKIGLIDRLLTILVHEEDTRFEHIHEPDVKADASMQHQMSEDVETVIDSANKTFQLECVDATTTLDEDPAARISVILLSLVGMVDSM